MKKNNYIILLISLTFACFTNAQLSMDEKQQLFDSANIEFSKANSVAKDTEARNKSYDQAIIHYQTIIEKGGVQNSKLYYNLANAYLLKDDIGRAILYYRKAQKLDPSDHNITKNLAFARSQKKDSFKVQTKTKVLQTLFFWYYDFSIKTRFILAITFFASFCLLLAILILKGRKTRLFIPVMIFCFLFIVMASSVVVSHVINTSTQYGVIISNGVETYQGDGTTYLPAFEQPLNSGTEFELLQDRNGWYQILLLDNTDCWIKSEMAEKI